MVDSGEGCIGKRKPNGKEGNQKRTWFPKIILVWMDMSALDKQKLGFSHWVLDSMLR